MPVEEMPSVMKKTAVAFIAVAGLIISLWMFLPGKKENTLSQIAELKVRITSSTAIPDSTNIGTTGDWYYLDHISSSLVAFDSSAKKFVPRIAEKWESMPDGTHVFTLRTGVKFHDGTPITVKDVIWSIKRQLIKKTATHFRFWGERMAKRHSNSG